MGKKILAWNENLFYKAMRLMPESVILERIRTSDDEHVDKIELLKPYPIYRDLFGVKIESGQISVRKIILPEALDLCSLYLVPELNGKTVSISVHTDLTEFVLTTKKYGLELPDLDTVSGYILNNELVTYYHFPDYDAIKFKYKDGPQNIFYSYYFSFSLIRDELYLVIQKEI